MQTELNFETLRGMRKAEDHANEVRPGWSQEAYQFLMEFIQTYKGEFMAEDVREASKGRVCMPPSKRAWGGVIARASCDGKIRKVGIRSVKNPTAHNANASVWVAI